LLPLQRIDMKHHTTEEKNYDYLYYLVAIVTGIFVGAIIEQGFVYVIVGAVLGLLSAAFFLNVLVKGRGDA
jgi:hypothetical protein